MRRIMLWITATMFIAGAVVVLADHPAAREADVSLSGPSFPVGDLKFTIPSKWKIEPVESPARGGQWRVPPLHGEGDGGEVVVFYFGPGVGGSAKENIEAWIGTMFTAEGHPAAAEVKHHKTGGLTISQVVMFGAYNRVVSLP